mgnify:CR=1 FL=1
MRPAAPENSPSLRLTAWVRRAALALGGAALVVDTGYPPGSIEYRVAAAVLPWLAALLAAIAWVEHVAAYLAGASRAEGRGRRTGAALWLIGLAVVLAAFPSGLHAWGRLGMILAVAASTPSVVRRLSLSGLSPAAALVLSFAGLIAIGTVLLLLPNATTGPEGAPIGTALFTAVSAVTVTGLVVEDTGAYWSRWGQTVILILIQIGGLGLMTFGAFFAVLVGRGLLMREAALLGDLFEQKMLAGVRRLLLGVVLTTVVFESLGALALSPLWADEPLQEQVFQSVFHSVSAFCNAGFSVRRGGLTGLPVGPVLGIAMCGLIILGGLGFTVISNLAALAAGRWRGPPRRRTAELPPPRPRLDLTTRLSLVVTGVLLLVGPLGVLVLEAADPAASAHDGLPWYDRIADAWFTSVNCRTAGFSVRNPIDYGEATRFWMMLLMFVGGSPGSTAGGVKTVALAVTVMTLWTVLRGRERVEVAGRSVPEMQARRALLIVVLAAALAGGATLLLTAVEGRRGTFLDMGFEVISALATVGLSSVDTATLGPAGRTLIMLLMFFGRVGPLTLLLAMAGRPAAERYRYPEERVALG